MMGQRGKIWLCLTMAMWLAAPVYASKPLWTNHLSEFAASSPRQTQAELKRGHDAINRSLGVRAQRLRHYEQLVAERDEAAQVVQQLKEKSGQSNSQSLQNALRKALDLDEAVSMKRADLAGAESDLAQKGARLLELYDRALLEKRSEIERFAAQPAKKRRALQTYRLLSEQRDRVRSVLRPVLQNARMAPSKQLPALEVGTDDDIETLLEKADLARDLEERFLRQAEAVRKRILEMEAERSLARDVIGLIQNESLFDESDRRLVMEGRNLGAAPSARGFWSSLGGRGAASAEMSAGPDSSARMGGEDESSTSQNSTEPVQSDSAMDSAPPEEGAAVDDSTFTENSDLSGTPGASTGTSTVTSTIPALMGQTELVAGENTMVSQSQLSKLMLSGNLSLADLKALEKQLQKQAKTMQQRNLAIQEQIEKQSGR